MSVPGWYPDPSGSGRRRWWDGSQWGPVEPGPAYPPPLPVAPVPVLSPEEAAKRSRNNVTLYTGIAAFVVLVIILAGVNGRHTNDSRREASSTDSAGSTLSSKEDRFMRSLIIDAPAGHEISVVESPSSLYSREKLIAAGQELCRYRQHHQDAGSIVAAAYLSDTYHYTFDEAGQIQRAATDVFCPEFRNR